MKNRSESLISGRTALWALIGMGAYTVAKTLYRAITNYDFFNRVVLITGGSRGLGLAIAREVAKKGAKLVICSRTGTQLAKAKAELEEMGAEVLTYKIDISNQNEVQKMIKDATDYYGHLDVLINNAGVISVGPENVMEVKDYKKVMNTNLWPALYTIKAAIPHFTVQGEGRIVNICSIGGKLSVPHLLPYSVSKFAMVGLSEGLSAELKKDNIQVTTVIPNLMRTGSPRNVTVKGDHEAEYAWFKVADSSPLLSQNATQAAKQIVKAIERGNNEVILTMTAKVAIAMQGLMPNTMTSIMQLANRLLPQSGNIHEKKGFESESDASDGEITALTDEAAIHYNEL